MTAEPTAELGADVLPAVRNTLILSVVPFLSLPIQIFRD